MLLAIWLAVCIQNRDKVSLSDHFLSTIFAPLYLRTPWRAI